MVLKCISVIAAVGALTCGLVTANYWYKSSIVEYGPNWDLEPVVEEYKILGRFDAIMKATTASSTLNKLAARWTAASVVLSAISAIAGAI